MHVFYKLPKVKNVEDYPIWLQSVFSRGSQPTVIPVAVKIIDDSKNYLVEFVAVERGAELNEDVLVAETSVIYELVLPVNRIGSSKSRCPKDALR
jgi:hypothetical protein